MILMIFYIAHQHLYNIFPILFICQVKIERQRACSLSLADDPASCGVIFFPERVQRLFMEHFIICRLFIFSQHMSRLCHKLCDVYIVSVCHKVNICSSNAFISHLTIQCQPVTILVIGHPQPVFIYMIVNIIYPLVHTFP